MQVPKGPGPPTKTVKFLCGGEETEIVVSEFSDRFFILITQLGKIGSLVEASCDCLTNGVFSVRTVLGDRKKEGLQLLGRVLIEHIAQS
eukprot:Cvel_8221.t1-p1 / transcript=Cvel_8221.t1 / gene=Cvel_8221 / organism=Chromera_velia_CCMP2878 / gene_product=hypothetical protein / transcript_product=hypothetical protein / location=Cvel_scaffold449:438-1388(-) / protein_length=88 / sequence_SO=supercontig / SO=protein_coding / is_pseudo=false